jgi:hypothetical protein
LYSAAIVIIHDALNRERQRNDNERKREQPDGRNRH